MKAAAAIWAVLSIFTQRACAAELDPFEGDPRMAVKRTIRVHDQPVADFLADLNIQTGIRFYSQGGVADDRVTVTAHDRPLGETLKAVAGLFHDAWKREGESADRGYALIPSPAQLDKEEKARLARIELAADAILEEIQAFDRYEKTPLPELIKRSNELEQELKDTADPDKRRRLKVEIGVTAQLAGGADWRKLINRFFRTVDRATIVSIMRGTSEEYSFPPGPGSKPLSTELMKVLRLGSEANPNDLPGTREFINLRLISDSSSEPAIRWDITIGKKGPGGTQSLSFRSKLPSTADLFPRERLETPGPPDWMGDPMLTAGVTFSVATPYGNKPPDAFRRRCTLGDALVALDTAKPLDCVADAFYSTRIAGFDQKDGRVGEALDRLCQVTGHSWKKEGGFVVVRSLSFDADRRAEPPAKALARWFERALGASLDLDDYADMAALPDEKLGTLKQMGLRGDFPDSLQPLHQSLEQLRLWNSLTRTQRRAAQSDGISYASMNKAQQRLMTLAADESAGRMTDAKLRLIPQVSKLWGIRTERGPDITGHAGREEAVEYFRSKYRDLKEKDVKQIVSTSVRFVFEGQHGVFAQSSVSLPAVWQDYVP